MDRPNLQCCIVFFECFVDIQGVYRDLADCNFNKLTTTCIANFQFIIQAIKRGKQLKAPKPERAFNSLANFFSTGRYFVAYHSTATPPSCGSCNQCDDVHNHSRNRSNTTTSQTLTRKEELPPIGDLEHQLNGSHHRTNLITDALTNNSSSNTATERQRDDKEGLIAPIGEVFYHADDRDVDNYDDYDAEFVQSVGYQVQNRMESDSEDDYDTSEFGSSGADSAVGGEGGSRKKKPTRGSALETAGVLKINAIERV